MLSAVTAIVFIASASGSPPSRGATHSAAAVIFISPLRAFKIDLGVPAGAGRPLGPDWLRFRRRDRHIPAGPGQDHDRTRRADAGRHLGPGWLRSGRRDLLFPEGAHRLSLGFSIVEVVVHSAVVVIGPHGQVCADGCSLD